MRVLVTGAAGQLGTDLVRAFSGAVPVAGTRRSLFGPGGPGCGVDVVGFDHEMLRVDDRDRVTAAVRSLHPDVVVHAAAWTAVDACELDQDRAYRVNALGVRHVAEAARAVGAHLVYVSTDYVFDGEKGSPYVEWDEPRPICVYGKSKLGGERECPPDATIVRTSWVCGAAGQNMVKTALRLASQKGPLRFVDDQRGSPTFCADLSPAVVTLALDRRPGIYHVTNAGDATWFELVRAVLEAAGDDPARVEPVKTADLDPPRPAARPKCSVLENAALRLGGLPLLPDWHDALERLVRVLV